MNQADAIAARARWLLSDRAQRPRFARIGSVALILTIASGVTLAAVLSDLQVPFLAWDTHAYWTALNRADPYAGAGVGVIGSYLYPPPFLQILAPFGSLPFPVFLFGWTVALGVAVRALLRRVPRTHRSLWPVLLTLAAADIWAGNINVLLAYAVVLGVTHPAAWAPVALTKVTPGVGMAWLAFRGRWKDAGIALLVTIGVAAASVAMDPNLWSSWLAVMLGENPAAPYQATIHIPIVFRLPIALTILAWAARDDRAWLVPVACLVALPVIWFNGLSLLIGSAALASHREQPRSVAA